MSDDNQRPVQSHLARPPIGRRPARPVTPSGRAAPEGGDAPGSSASGPARLLIGAHLLLLVQSGLIVFSRIELGAARTRMTVVTAVAAAAFIWEGLERFRKPSCTPRRHHRDA